MTTPMRTDAELKALPHLKWRTIFTEIPEEGKPGLSDEDREALDKHFDSYVQVPLIVVDGKPILENCDCVACGNPLGREKGPLADLVRIGPGGFTWGIAHGEGYCIYCGWPCSGHHTLRRADGTVLFHLPNFILQYHPEYVPCGAVRHRMLAKSAQEGHYDDD